MRTSARACLAAWLAAGDSQSQYLYYSQRKEDERTEDQSNSRQLRYSQGIPQLKSLASSCGVAAASRRLRMFLTADRILLYVLVTAYLGRAHQLPWAWDSCPSHPAPGLGLYEAEVIGFYKYIGLAIV